MLENSAVGGSLSWHVVEAVVDLKLLCHLSEVVVDGVGPCGARAGREHGLVADINKSKDLVDLEGNFDESPEVKVLHLRWVVE